MRTLDEDYPEDVSRLMLALERSGRFPSRAAVVMAWESYSAAYCAGWIDPPQDEDECVRMILPFLHFV
jgi:hypothetical protein